MIRASVVSPRRCVTRTISAPWPLMVPANTSSPGSLAAGIDSPVIGAWFTSLCPDDTTPSSGTFSPGLITTTSPRAMPSTGTRTSRPSRRTRASFGDNSMSALMARRARSMLRDSTHCASAKRKVTAAASAHWPMAMAPATAMSISVLMSSAKSRAADQARRAQYQPPVATDSAKNTPAAAGGAPTNPARCRQPPRRRTRPGTLPARRSTGR